METFSVLLALCVGNSPVKGEFPPQRPVMESFDVFFDLCSLWRHCDVQMMSYTCHCNATSIMMSEITDISIFVQYFVQVNTTKSIIIQL